MTNVNVELSIFLLLTVFAQYIQYVQGGFLGGLTSSATDSSVYLYYGKDDAKGLIIEHRPEDRGGARPDFLYNPTTTSHRVVEYYSHWCHHCVHFRDHYVEAAKQVRTVLKILQPTTTVEFYAISCVPNHDICTERDIKFYPTIEVYNNNNNDTKKPNASLSARQVSAANIIILNLKIPNITNPQINDIVKNMEKEAKEATKKNTKQQSIWESKTNEELYNDVYLSFDFNLRNSIFTSSSNPLNETQKQALKSWLVLLQVSLPVDWEHIHVVVAALLQDFNSIVESPSNLLAVLKRHPHPILSKKNPKWWSTACNKGDITMGYSCGLWQLFHTITVGMVENYNTTINNKKDTNTKTITAGTTLNLKGSSSTPALLSLESFPPPATVPDTIRNFIDNFFQCDECRTNFINDYDSCLYNRCNRLKSSSSSSESSTTLKQYIDVAMWLIETHNGVNVRLFKEQMKREGKENNYTAEDITKRYWPSRDDCDSCWLKKTATVDEDPVLNPTETFTFLKSQYWPGDTTKTSDSSMMMVLSIESIKQFAFLTLTLAILIVGGLQYHKKRYLYLSGRHKRWSSF